MNTEETYCFNLLKKQVAATFLKHHSAPILIKDWKGEDIVSFQEDLFDKVRAKVSEKWFYTYFKNDTEKLPRIDMLNLLSKYIGEENWNAFKQANQTNSKIKKNNPVYLYGFIIIILAIIIALFFRFNDKNEFSFCFVGDIKNKPITSMFLDIKVLQDKESPLYFKTDSLGCFTYKTKADYIKFVVQSPYHKTDTIIRYIDSNTNNTVRLRADDYALMLHYYSNGNVKDWNKHKANLNALIHNDAKIYQLFDNNIGVEVYTKADFIRLITIPTSNLKHFEVLDKSVENEKIVKLKFIIK